MNELRVRCEVDGQVTSGHVQRRDLASGERARRAGKMLGAFWLAAGLFVFVPVLHFILPPIALILGMVFGWTTWMERGMIVSGELQCPNCKREVKFQPGAEDWPRVQRCDYCYYTLTITVDRS